jgi:hypothetical protein
VGSNPSASANTEKWLSGLKHWFAKPEARKGPQVQILSSPPISEEWLSGLKRSLGKRVAREGSQVQILSLPPGMSAFASVWLKMDDSGRLGGHGVRIRVRIGSLSSVGQSVWITPRRSAVRTRERPPRREVIEMKDENEEDGVENPDVNWHVLMVKCPNCGKHPEATKEWPGFGGRVRVCQKCRQEIPAGAWSTWVVVSAGNAEEAMKKATERLCETK